MSPQMKLGLVLLFATAASLTVVLNIEEINKMGDLINNQGGTQQQPAVKAEKPNL